MSPFSRQIRAVLRVYTSSWLAWLVLAIYLILFSLIVGFDSRSNDATYSVGFANLWNLTPWSQLPSDPRSITSLSLNSSGPTELGNSEMMLALKDGSPLRTPGGMPRLKDLVIHGSIVESQLIPLLEHLQLESLSITYLESFGPAGWDALARQPLKSLDILSADDRFWENAKFPSSLETLLIRKPSLQQHSQDQTHLKPLSELTHLRTLQLHLWEREEGGLRPADQKVISRLPSLHQFYIDGYLPDFAVRVQAQFPSLSVRPGTYLSTRLSNVQLLMTLTGLPVVLLLHILSLQFATSASKLKPGFNSPHLWVAAGLILALIAVQTAGLISVRSAAPAALALASAVFIPAYLLTLLLNGTRGFPGHVNLAIAGPVMVCQVVLFVSLTMISPAETDWFLAGHRTDLTFILFALSLFSIAGLARSFDQLARTLAERSSVAVPFDVWDFAALQRWQLEGRPDSQQVSGAKIWSGSQRRRLEQAIHSPHSSPRHQALLWRASQMFTAVGFLIYMACVMSGVALFGYLVAPRQLPVHVFPMAALAQVCALSTFVPLIILQMQRTHLVQHLLMTFGRREWVWLIFRETARDFIPAVLLAIIGLVVRPFWSVEGLWPTWHLAIFGAACLILVFAIQMILVTYPTWVFILVCFILMFAGVLFTPFIVVVAKDRTSILGSGVLAWPATWWCLAFALAAIALRFAYHRWMTWELARINS